MAMWPKVSATIEKTFAAVHSLNVAGGNSAKHGHGYVARFGFVHEVSPDGLAGSKALIDWEHGIDLCLAEVSGKDLNEVCAPYPPTIEILAIRMLSFLPAFFESVELSSYSPKYTVRVDRKGARIEWPA